MHILLNRKYLQNFINPLTSLGEEVSEYKYPYLSAGTHTQREAKKLIILYFYSKKF